MLEEWEEERKRREEEKEEEEKQMAELVEERRRREEEEARRSLERAREAFLQVPNFPNQMYILSFLKDFNKLFPTLL